MKRMEFTRRVPASTRDARKRIISKRTGIAARSAQSAAFNLGTKTQKRKLFGQVKEKGDACCTSKKHEDRSRT